MPTTNGHGPKRAILYARVSTDEQARTGFSLTQQLEALREYAAREAGTTPIGASKPIGGKGHTAALYRGWRKHWASSLPT
jgi:hypothetical protein